MLTNLTNLANLGMYNNIREPGIFNPIIGTPILFWYDLNDASTCLTYNDTPVTTNNAAVYKILDKSGKNHHLYNNSGTAPSQNFLRLNSIGTRPSIHTTGTSVECGFTTKTSPPMDNGLTFFCVSKFLGNGSRYGGLVSKGIKNHAGPIDTYRTLRLVGKSTSSHVLSVQTDLSIVSPPRLLNFNFNRISGEYTEFVNSSLTNYISYDNSNYRDSLENLLYIGTRADKITFDYHMIGEIIGYNGPISVELRQKIEGYLMHKWGLASSLPSNHPFKNAAPTS